MNIPEKTQKLIEQIAEQHSSKVFGYLEQSDIKQVIWIICIQALPKYNEKFGPLEHFLRKTVKNRLVNKFKETTKSVRSPCPRCKYYSEDPKKFHCTKFGDNKDDCNKFKNYKLSIISRNSLLNATEEQVQRYYEVDPAKLVEYEEIKDIIINNLNKKTLGSFNSFLSGEAISKQNKAELFEEIREILGNKGILDDNIL